MIEPADESIGPSFAVRVSGDPGASRRVQTIKVFFGVLFFLLAAPLGAHAQTIELSPPEAAIADDVEATEESPEAREIVKVWASYTSGFWANLSGGYTTWKMWR